MGLIKKWITGSDGQKTLVYNEAECKELAKSWQEFRLQELAYDMCVNFIANAVSRCDFKTYRNGQQVKEAEHFLWNVRPNFNQNSTEFLHKMIRKLYDDNEVLIIETTQKGTGKPQLLVADSFSVTEYVIKANEYTEVVVDDYLFNKTFKATDVLHLRLNEEDIKPALNAMQQSLSKVIELAVKNFRWKNGKHWKVHIDQIQQGDQNFTANYAKMIEKQLKPFLESESAVLPEFDGYTYTDENGKTTDADSRDIKALADDIISFTAKGLHVPPVLLNGDVAGTKEARKDFLTFCVDPICDQLQEEINGKRYGAEEWARGNYLSIDTSAIIHVDIFENAANVEKLIGSGYSPNEVRTAFGQPEIDADWAREHYITKNFELAEKMLQEGGAE